MSSDSKVDARHVDDDDGFENLPADDKNKEEEEELKEPEVYTAKGKPRPPDVNKALWVQLILFAGLLLVVYSLSLLLRIRTNDTAPDKVTIGFLVLFCGLGVYGILGAMSILAVLIYNMGSYAAVMETLHAHRMETYRLHKELRATRAKKYRNV